MVKEMERIDTLNYHIERYEKVKDDVFYELWHTYMIVNSFGICKHKVYKNMVTSRSYILDDLHEA